MDLLSIRPRARKLALAAATLAITAGPDPVAGIPTQLGVTGSVNDHGHYVAVRYRPAPGATCGGQPTDDGEGVPLGGRSILSAGPFAAQGNVTVDRAGDYLVCAWMVRYGLGEPDTVVAARSRVVTVRAPRLGLAIAATPSSVLAGQAVQVAYSAQAEVERALYLYALPDVGHGCAANAEAASKTDGAFAVVRGRSILGGPVSAVEEVALERSGTWLLCGYLQREYAWDPPEAVAQATVTVAAPPSPCVVPAVIEGEPLAGATARVLGASCSVGVVRYAASARHDRGSVCKVAPSPGTHLDPGARVDLWVSSGAPCVVPALPESRMLAAVRQRLAAAGCRAGRVTHRRSASVRRGRVVALARPRGTKLPPRSRVAMVVSRGRG